MADTKVSALAAGTAPLAGTEIVPIVQAASTVRTTAQLIANIGQAISAASKLLGRGSASGAGNAVEITIDSSLTMTGTTLSVTTLTGTAGVLAKDTDGTLAANSDLRIATQKATKTYVDAALVTAEAYTDSAVANKAQDRRAVSVITPSAGVANIDCSLGDYFTLAPTANVTSITFSNLPGASKGASLWIRFTQDSTPRTVAWPASFKWDGGSAGAVSTGSGAKDVIAITTVDNGTTWDITLSKARA